MNTDTIAAIATAPGTSGIGIIRLSGINAIEIANKIFRSNNKKKLKELENRKLHYGWIVSGNDKILDEVLVSYIKAPYSYTKEDVVEINCHGGMVAIEKILHLILEYNCRLAERGEFTKRAFLNGRLDLTQAEAVMDLISAKTKNSFNISLHQLEGRLSKEINILRNQLLSLIANIQVNIDFPEYDEENITIEQIKIISREIIEKLNKLINTADTGKIYKEGIKTLILGKPNVGKSSLMNYLLNENRAIVTDIPGTTRDLLEEYVNLAGIPLKIIDTAGIRKTDDVVEKIGVERALSKISEADLIIVVFDSSVKIEEDDKRIIEYVKNKNVIYLLNKTDIERKIDFSEIKEIEKQIVKISVINNQGLEDIEKIVKEKFLNSSINLEEDTIVNNIRHKNLIVKARNALEEAYEAAESGRTLELIEIDIRDTIEYLGEITGNSVKDDIMEKIFSEFCIGK